MTVTTTGARDVKLGDGSTTGFPTTFQFFGDTSLLVTLIDSAGAETALVLNSDYTVAGGEGGTGTINMAVAPASGEVLVIERETPLVQALDLVANDILPAESIETVADQLVLIAQEVAANIQRAPLVARDFTGGRIVLDKPVEGTLLTWDSQGNLVNTQLAELDTDTVTATTFGGSLVESANADSARSLLQLDDASKAGDVDASFLEGQPGSFYSNVTARLGYTPVDKAGDVMSGQLTVDKSGPWFVSKDGTPNGSNQGLSFRAVAGLPTLTPLAGTDPSGPINIGGDNPPQWSGPDGQKDLAVQPDLLWKPVAAGTVPSNVTEFDVPIDLGFKRYKIIVRDWQVSAPTETGIRFKDSSGNVILGDSGQTDAYAVQTRVDTMGVFDGSGNQSREAVDMFNWGTATRYGNSFYPIEGEIEAFNLDDGTVWGMVRGEMFGTFEDTGNERLAKSRFFGALSPRRRSSPASVKTLQFVADSDNLSSSTTFQGGTYEIYGLREP